MTLNILSKREGISSSIYDAVAAVSGEFLGDWQVSLINSPSDETTEVKLRAPNATRSFRENLFSEEVNGTSIQEVLRRLRERCISQVA
jgi:hypothetical protein